MTRDEEIEGIAMALDALLTAIAADGERAAADHTVGRSAAEVAAEMDWRQTEHQAGAAAIIADPVGRALRTAIEALGERLNEIGGLGLMQTVCDQVAALQPETLSWRAGMIDRRWDGIGDWLS